MRSAGARGAERDHRSNHPEAVAVLRCRPEGLVEVLESLLVVVVLTGDVTETHEGVHGDEAVMLVSLRGS